MAGSEIWAVICGLTDLSAGEEEVGLARGAAVIIVNKRAHEEVIEWTESGSWRHSMWTRCGQSSLKHSVRFVRDNRGYISLKPR